MADEWKAKGAALARRGAEGAGLIITPADAPSLPQSTLDRLERTLDERLAPRTRKEYASAWKRFVAWCEKQDPKLVPLPAHPTTICAYLEAITSRDVKPAGMSAVTIAVAAIGYVHGKEYKFTAPPTAAPAVSAFVDALKRGRGAPPQPKAPIIDDVLRVLIRSIPQDTWIGQRDRALLLFGRAFGGRRSEIVNVKLEHLEPYQDGYTVFIPESKGDRLHEGERVPIVYAEDEELCGVRAMDAWISKYGVKSYIFSDRDGNKLDPRQVSLTVKRACAYAGLSEPITAKFSSHSLRSGHATQAALNKAPEHVIQRQLRHKNRETTEQYIKRAKLELENSGMYLGRKK